MLSQAIVLASLAALAAGSTTTASASICTQTATVTIQSTADATAYADCTTFDGSIEIGTSATGTIAIDGIQEITGSLISSNATGVTAITSTSITTIGGTFGLQSMTILSNVQFSVLTSANEISFEALPALSSLNFASYVSTCSSLTITNTFLSSLDGINLMTADVIYIADNSRLTEFSTQIGNVTNSIDINNNGNSLTVAFPNLIWAAQLTLRNVSDVSIPSLASINGSFGLYGNTFESLSAPNLTNVGTFSTGIGGITIDDNPDLVNLTLPVLATVGGLFQISANDELYVIDVPKLSEVGGAVDFTGNFTTPELPDLSNVKGVMNLQSESDITCTGFDKLKGNIVQGSVTCKTTATTTTTTGGGSSTSSGSSSSSTSKSAAISYGVSEALAGLSVVGALFQMLV